MKLLSKKFSKSFLLLIPLLILPHLAFAKVGFMEEALWNLVSGFFGLFLGIAATLLDYAVSNFVIGFGTFFSEGTVGTSVNALWENVRDIFNITFIFGLVYIGFKMILDSDNSNTRKALIYLILATLLVNFSLLITKVVIDVSNNLATQIAYDGLPINDEGFPSISTAFMGGTGLHTVLNPNDLSDVIEDGGLSYIFGSMIFYIVAIFVFASGAFLLFIRFGVLLLYMIFSPFMFIGWVFPQLSNYTSQYWRGFLGRAFFAPLYLLLTFLSMTIVTEFYSSKTQGTVNLSTGLGADGAVTTAAISNHFPPFIIASILMIASVLIASKLGANGANGVMSFGRNMAKRGRQSLQRNAGNMTFGAAGAVGRNTIGRGANTYANSSRGKRLAADTALGRYAMKMAQKTSAASFDARNINGVGKEIGIGSGKTGGYIKTVEDRKKADATFLKTIATDKVDFKDEKVKEQIRQQTADQINNVEKKRAERDNKKAEKDNLMTDKTKLETEKTELEKEKAQLEKEKAEIDEKVQKFNLSETDRNQMHSEADNKIANKNTEISSKTTEIDTKATEIKKTDSDMSKIMSDVNKVKKELTDAEELAMSKMQFANEIAYMEQLKRNEEKYKRLFTAVRGTLGGVGGGAGAALLGAGAVATSGAVGAVGAGAALATNAESDRIKASRESLLEKYGENGLKEFRKQNKKKKTESVLESLGSQVDKETVETEKKQETPSNTDSDTNS